MGLKVQPAYIGDPTFDHPVELDRNILEGIFNRTGALRFGDFALSVGVGTRAIAVAPGRYFLLGVENAAQGGYVVWSDAVETKLLAAAVGDPRIDSFILRVHDNQYGTIPGAPTTALDVVQGVAAAVPTARPDSDFNSGGPFYVPGAWARLGDVRVNVADTGSIPGGQITNALKYVRVGGRTVAPIPADLPSDTVTGDTAYIISTKATVTYDGSSWLTTGPRKFTANIGDGTSLTYTLTHNFGTRNVSVTVYRNSTPWDNVYPGIERPTTDSVLLRFAIAPTTNQYSVVVDE